MSRASGVTIRDVARRAGVSIAAVSMALNGTGSLSEATRIRVRAVAAEMDYQADALARGLRRSSVGAVGIVMRALDALGEYQPRGVDVFARYIATMATQAMERGLSAMLVPDPTRGERPPLALSLDGYIVAQPMLDDPVVALFERRGIPYVTLGRDPGRPDFTDWVGEDPAATIRTLDLLGGRGARSVALLRGTDVNDWNLENEQIYRDWCAGRGVRPRVYTAAERDGESGGRRAARVISAEGLPDGIFALTGRHAVGVLHELQAQGVPVPTRTMIATASDSEHTRHSRPAITAIEIDVDGTARALLDLLQARIRGERAPGPVLTSARLRRRASTRPAPQR
jgi:DNA-binding LacI/PurR family transcriptional regulator